MSALIGRERELRQLEAVLAEPADALPMLLRGSRGSGLSALLEHAASHAEQRGIRVLRARGVPTEAAFAYAGLHQLLRPLRRDVAALPQAQRDALRSSFDPADGDTDRFRVGLAVLDLLSAVAARSSVLLCIDDGQDVDPETLEVVAFVARRLAGERVALVVGAHDAEVLAGIDATELRLAPLGEPDAWAVLAASAPELGPFARAKVLDLAGGSPLALAELPHALTGADEAVLLTAYVPLTPRLLEAFAGGFGELPEEARVLLRVAALDDEDRSAEVLAVASEIAGRPLTGEDLAAAAASALVRLDTGRLAFAHDLTRVAVHQLSSASERQAVHRAWAVRATGDDRATWHRSTSTAGIDAPLADELDRAAQRAVEADVPVKALVLLRSSAERTPPGGARDARLVRAADLADQLGAFGLRDRLLAQVDFERLDALGHARLAAMAPPGGRSVRVMLDHAADAAAHGDGELCDRLLVAAAMQADRTVRDDGEAIRVAAGRWSAGGSPAMVLVRALLDPRRDEAAVFGAVRGSRPERAGDALVLAYAALVAGDPHAALRLLDGVPNALRSAGRLRALLIAHALTAWASAKTSDLDRAARHAADGRRVGVEAEQPFWIAICELTLGLVAALRGEPHDAELHAAATERLALPTRTSSLLARAQRVRALAALAEGRPSEALAYLSRVIEPSDPAHEPSVAAALAGDLAEAAVGDGERAVVVEHLRRFAPTEAPAPAVSRALATYVLAADDEADEAFLRARACVTERWPLEHGRMLLAHGMRLRRMRRVADSREPLRRAQAVFADLGATAWAERAARELAATTETANRSGDEAHLTPRELEIARMAARGMTNRAIGDQLTLSPRTVGSHLAHIFPKLGVASRGALADALEAHRDH